MPTTNESASNSKKQKSKILSPQELQIGTYYNIDKDGLQVGCIVERRFNDGVEEYYIHYEGLDRRLDEWVTADRIKNIISKPKSEGMSQIIVISIRILTDNLLCVFFKTYTTNRTV